MRHLINLLVFLIGMLPAAARDRGQYASTSPEVKAWFDKLRSGNGPCCSDADGTALSDADWVSINDPNKPTVHYRVMIDKKWWDVPDDAVITEPNIVGHVMVWPVYYRGYDGDRITIRCFMPGALI